MLRFAVAQAAAFVVVTAGMLEAAPITASVDGCVTHLPDGVATWTSSEHFQFVAFWDPVPGCEPTIAHPVVVHEWLENYDGTGGLKVQTAQPLLPKCGRVQFDAHVYLDGPNFVLDPLGLVSLVVDTGVVCEAPPIRPPDPPRQAPEPDAIWLMAIGTATVVGWAYKRRAGREPAH